MTNDTENHWQTNYTDLLAAGTSESTRRAYQRDVAYFWAWAQLDLNLNQTEHYPVDDETVVYDTWAIK